MLQFTIFCALNLLAFAVARNKQTQESTIAVLQLISLSSQYFTMPLWGSCVFKLISYAHALVGIMVHQLVWKCGDDIEDEQPQKEVLCERK